MPIQIEGSAPTREVVQPLITEFKSIKPLDSQRAKQVEAFLADLKQVMDYVNKNRGGWGGTEEEAVMLKKLNATAKGLGDPKLERAVLNFTNQIYSNPIFAVSTAEGLQHPFVSEIKDFFKENGYTFIITQSAGERQGRVRMDLGGAYVEKTLAFNTIEYVMGKLDESKIRGYGNTGVRVDFLEGVTTNKSEYLAGYADTHSGSVVVVKSDAYKRAVERQEKRLERMGEEERKLVDNFEKSGNEEIAAYANRENPLNPNAVMTDIVLLKVTHDYLKREGETQEQKLARVRMDVNGMTESHELGEKIIMMKAHDERSFQSEKKQVGGREVYIITGPPIVAVNEESTFRGWEREMVCDMLALAERTKVTLINNLEHYQSLVSQAPEEEEKRRAYPQFFEASKYLIDSIVKYVEENREKFPEVKKSGILVLGELNDKQISEISKALLEKKYMEKGYAFDYSLVF
jgi:hypothetical protein